jgi:hypothetical protein
MFIVSLKGRHLALVDAAQKSSLISSGDMSTFVMDLCARRDETGHWESVIEFGDKQS